jgi:CBS domain-containing protein
MLLVCPVEIAIIIAMPLLSTFLQFRVCDNSRRPYDLDDIGIALLESDYPAVTHFVYRNSGRQHMTVPWDAVTGIDWPRSRIHVKNFDAAQLMTDDSLRQEVLLKRDVLDALVLDLFKRVATRANDLLLEEENGKLLLKAADTSSLAILRRLNRRMFGRRPSRGLADWKYIEFLRGDPRAVRSGAGYHMRIKRLPPGDIAGLSSSLPYLHAAELLTLLPDPIAADTLEAMPHNRQVQVFGELDVEQAVHLLQRMGAKNAADLLRGLRAESAKGFLERLPKARSAQLVELLRYPEATVGGIMTNDILTLAFDQTIRDARLKLHERLKQKDFAHFVYVVESESSEVLRGTISLQDLIVAGDEQRLDEITNVYVTTLDPLGSADAGAYRVLSSHLAALPVVGRDKTLLGIVTVDAAVMQVAPQNWTALAPKVFS